MVRTRFVFSDSLQVGGYLGANCGEGSIQCSWIDNTGADLVALLPNMYFAGIVCVANN